MKKRLLVLFLLSSLGALQGQEGNSFSENNGSTFGQVWNSSRRPVRENPNLYEPNFSEAQRLKEYDLELARYKNGNQLLQMAKIKVFFEEMGKPQNVAYAGATALLVFGAWHTGGLLRDLAYQHFIIPPLAQKTSIKSWTSQAKSFFVRDEEIVAPRNEVILSDKLIDKAAVLTQSTINAAQNDTNFRHYLFYGPPGTGKTMLAMAMAKEAGMEYIYFSAAKLKQYSDEETVKQVARLFEYAKAYPKKLMIIIDEADNLFARRDNCSEKSGTLIDLVLTYMGTEQSDSMVIGLTNRPQEFDDAALSRFGEQVEIGPPGMPERRAMFVQYVQKYFVNSHTINRDRRTFIQSLFTKKPTERQPLVIAEDVLTSKVFDELAQKSDGLVGRDISDILLSVQNAAYGKPDLTVTQQMIFTALEDKKKQQETRKNGFDGYGTKKAESPERGG